MCVRMRVFFIFWGYFKNYGLNPKSHFNNFSSIQNILYHNTFFKPMALYFCGIFYKKSSLNLPLTPPNFLV